MLIINYWTDILSLLSIPFENNFIQEYKNVNKNLMKGKLSIDKVRSSGKSHVIHAYPIS